MSSNMDAHINELRLSNFRNYDYLELRIDKRPVILYGLNGSGKTNILEAISLFSPGNGIRGTNLADITNSKNITDNWVASVNINGLEGDVSMGLSYGQSQDKANNKTIKIAKEEVKSTNHFRNHLRILWLSPAMDRLFVDAASKRRKFIDRLIAALEPSHSTRLNAYENVMRQRNLLLQNKNADVNWLSALETQMAEYAIAIAATRKDRVNKLSAITSTHKKNCSELEKYFPLAKLQISGEIEDMLEKMAAIEVEDEYCKKLFASRKIDAITKRTSIGIHKSDLKVRHIYNNIDASLCSTGEQKSLLISIMMAELELVTQSCNGFAPILLLDEITAHLDDLRRDMLFERLIDMKIQCWMSGVDKKLFNYLHDKAQYVEVSDGNAKLT